MKKTEGPSFQKASSKFLTRKGRCRLSDAQLMISPKGPNTTSPYAGCKLGCFWGVKTPSEVVPRDLSSELLRRVCANFSALSSEQTHRLFPELCEQKDTEKNVC